MLKRKRSSVCFTSLSLLLCIFVAASHTLHAQSTTTVLQVSYLETTTDVATNQRSSADSVTLITTSSSEAKRAMPQINMHPKAVRFVADYLKTNTESLEKIKKRSAAPFKTFDAVFKKYNLPAELKYLAVIESELKTSAVSSVGAVGPWQLMPGTARMLGLKVTAKYDERKLYYKSTVAVAKYITDLYDEFGDWLLVIAAYNGGPGVVYNAVKKSGSHDFWRLQNFLPAETRAHVKRFIGAHYYFEEKGSETTLTKFETIAYKKRVAAFLEETKELQKEEAPVVIPVTADAVTSMQSVMR